MSRIIAIQMDPIDSIDIEADSTFALALEAQRRGHALFYYTPDSLAQFSGGKVMARGQMLEVRRQSGDHFSVGEKQLLDLAAMDVVLLRQDPPFDMNYITTTHILERLHPETLVVNDPFWVRNMPEKTFVTEFPDLTPPTLFTRDLDMLKAFRARHGDIIIKPLYGNGGAGVFRVTPADKNLASLYEMFMSVWPEPFVVQKFLPDVAAGDKRVILVDGEAVGAINRIPQEGETRSNMHVGGRAAKAELSARDRDICATIGPALREAGQIFVGIDIIGGYLTEINVTSPTGIQELSRFDGIDVPAMIWDAIEGRL